MMLKGKPESLAIIAGVPCGCESGVTTVCAKPIFINIENP
jgi:hypothetical protein